MPVAGEPSPKFQFHVVIVFVAAAVDKSVKVTTEPTQLDVGVNAATGP